MANLPQEATSLVVRRSGGASGGWLIAWSALLDRGESLNMLALAPDGTPRGAPSDIQRTSDHIAWADVIATTRGAVCVWAEEPVSGDASFLAAAVGSDGRPRGMPVRVSRGVRRWQAVSTGDGVGLAFVGANPSSPSGGTLTWSELDSEGRPRGGPVVITSRPMVGSDVDVVSIRDRWLLAWTDRTSTDAQIMLAAVDSSGHVEGPKPAMNAVGGSSLIALTSGPENVALLWEEPRARARETRTIHLGTVSTGGDLIVHPATSLDVGSQSAPELVAAGRGFGLLAPSHACLEDAEASPCVGPMIPTFVRFSDRLEPAQTEPLWLGDDRAAAVLAWGLSCAAEHCFVLAASGESPTPVFAVDLAPRRSPFAAPLQPVPPPEAPRTAGVATIASGQPYMDVAATRVGDTTLVATLTSVTGRLRERVCETRRGAKVAVYMVGADGQPTGAPATLTSKAIPLGGIALSAAGSSADGAIAAWVACDDNAPQVRLARLDEHGRRTSQAQLTRTKGGASHVAITWAEDGWLVAWVDARDGNGEVYATKVDRDLRRVVRDQRITNAPGDAADVALVSRGGVAWLAWTDSRESPREGLGDVYVTTLRTNDAERATAEQRVLATAQHSRSPELAPTPDGGAIVAWIEDPPTGLDGSGAAMVARLDAAGHVVGSPAKLSLSGGRAESRPVSIALSPAGDAVRAIVARASADVVTLDALLLGNDAALLGKPWPLIDLDAPPSFEIPLAFTGETLIFDDVGSSPSDHRVRGATIAWHR